MDSDWEIWNLGYWDALDIRAAGWSMPKGLSYLELIETRFGPKDLETYKNGFDVGWLAWEKKPVLRKAVIESYAEEKEAEKRRAAFRVINGGLKRGATVMTRSWENWSDVALSMQLKAMRDYASIFKSRPAEAEKHQQKIAALEAEIARRQAARTDEGSGTGQP